MLRTIKATVATMMVLALAACGNVTGPDVNTDVVGYDGNGPLASPAEMAPSSDEGGGGDSSAQPEQETSTARGRGQQHPEMAPVSDEGSGGTDPFVAPAAGDDADDDHDAEGGDYAPVEDEDGI